MDRRNVEVRFPQSTFYRSGRFEFTYRGRFFISSPRPPDVRKPANVPLITHRLLMSVAGVVTEKWDKPAAWVVAGFAAVAALAVSNYERAVQLTSAGAVKAVLILFAMSVVAHLFQKIAATFAQAASAGAEEGVRFEADELNAAEAMQLISGVTEAYPWPPVILTRYLFRRILAEGGSYLNRLVMRMVFCALGAAVLQVLFALVAIGVVFFSL